MPIMLLLVLAYRLRLNGLCKLDGSRLALYDKSGLNVKFGPIPLILT